MDMSHEDNLSTPDLPGKVETAPSVPPAPTHESVAGSVVATADPVVATAEPVVATAEPVVSPKDAVSGEEKPAQTAPIPQVQEEEITGMLAEKDIPVEVVYEESPDETTQTNGTVFDALAARVVELEHSLADEKSHRLRVLADLDNWRKRSARDLGNAVAKAQSDVVVEFLPVLDNLELALEHATEKAGIEGMREGVAMVLKQFRSSLAKFGIREIDASGHPFDPAFHEAMAQNPSEEVPPGFVIKQWKKGFMLGDRLVRPCRVVVSSGPGPSSENTPVDSSED